MHGPINIRFIINFVFPQNMLYNWVKYGAEKVITGNTMSLRVYPSYCFDNYFPLVLWRLITLSAVTYTLWWGGVGAKRGSYCSQNKSHCPPKRHYPARLYNGDVMCLVCREEPISKKVIQTALQCRAYRRLVIVSFGVTLNFTENCRFKFNSTKNSRTLRDSDEGSGHIKS